MNWIRLQNENQLDDIIKISNEKPVLIFKHSVRCSISNTVLGRMERSWKPDEVKNTPAYYLDILSYRPVSNKIEEIFGVQHESPQLLIIENGICTYDTSHFSISYEEIKSRFGELTKN